MNWVHVAGEDWRDRVARWLAGTGCDGRPRLVGLVRRAQHPDLLAQRLVRAAGLKLSQDAEHDGNDWAVDRQVLSLTDGLRWAEEVDPVARGLLHPAP